MPLGRRSFVLTLMRCEECLLKFRYPKQEEGWTEWFYQKTDTSGDELPGLNAIRGLVKNGFAGTTYDISRLINLLNKFNQGRLLDFGCSWGYGVWQYRKAGYDAIGFEISKPKASFGVNELGIEIVSNYSRLESLDSCSFDFIVASHVLEHLPQIGPALRLFSRLLRPGGKLVVLVPNAGGRSAMEWPGVWPFTISREHNLGLDASWFHYNLGHYGLTPIFSSSDFGKAFVSALAPYDERASSPVNLLEDELLMVAIKNMLMQSKNE